MHLVTVVKVATNAKMFNFARSQINLMKAHKIFLFFGLLCLYANAIAQELHYDHFTVRNGLLQMQVTTLFQDSKGHLWIGTKLGASRFDGKHFTNFTIQDGLPDSFVQHISEDSSGRILLLSRSGLAIFNGQGFVAYPTEIFNNRKALFAPVVKQGDSIFIYRTNMDNQLEAYYFDGNKYILKEQYFSPNDWETINDQIQMFYDLQSSTIYSGSANLGLNSIRNGKVKKILDVKEGIQSFTKGQDGNLYICYDSHFSKLSGDSVLMIYSDVVPIKSNTNYRFAVDKAGRFFFRENDSQRLMIIENGQIFKEQFDHGIITNLLLDRENNLWIGTEKGLYRNTSRAILNFIHKPGGINDYVWSVSEDKNGSILFAAYEQGLQRYRDGQFEILDDYKSLNEENRAMNFYMGSLRAKSGDVYLPITNKTLLRYDGANFFVDIKSEKQNVAFYVYEDTSDSSIFVGTLEGLYHLNQGHQEHWNVQPGNGRSNSITSLVKDRSGRVWIGGFKGISLLQNNEIQHMPAPGMPFPHGGNALLRDNLDNIWIGNPHGLFLYDNESFVNIDHPKLDKLVMALAMVGDSALLIGTIRELLMLDLKTFYQTGEVRIITVGPDKGYHAIEPGQNGFFRDSKGYYWLTNSDRVVRIDPAQISTNTIPPETYIRSVSLMNERMQWNPFENDQMHHPVFLYAKDEKNLRFEFTAVSLRDPSGITYSHFLEGYDKGWSAPDHESTAIYTNLQPGEYSLRFKAANTDGVWSVEKAFSFFIQPAFYQTIWFRVASVLLAASVLFFGGVTLTNQRRKKQIAMQENEKKMAEFQLLSIKNQIDPHFTYNAINSIASAVVKEDKDVAYRFFVKLSRLMRSILQSSDKLTRSLEDEINFVKDYLDIQKFRHKDRFDFSIDIAAGVEMESLVPKMCMQTFVENALKHGLLQSEHKGILKIAIKNEENNYVICIEDNGIGREKAAAAHGNSAGKGLQILKGYFDYFNRYNTLKISWTITDLRHEDGKAAGTEVKIVLPKAFKYIG